MFFYNISNLDWRLSSRSQASSSLRYILQFTAIRYGACGKAKRTQNVKLESPFSFPCSRFVLRTNHMLVIFALLGSSRMLVMREHLFFRVSGGPGFIFTEHRSVRVFFYRTSNGPGFPRLHDFPIISRISGINWYFLIHLVCFISTGL